MDNSQNIFHYCSITNTIGKYVYIYLTSRSKHELNTESPLVTVEQQSHSGLLLLASGCLGRMFHLYKRNRSKYGKLLKPLSSMIMDKKKHVIPKIIASQDKGGLYVIKRDFLPALRYLDLCLREEFAKVSHHQKDIIKVSSSQ